MKSSWKQWEVEIHREEVGSVFIKARNRAEAEEKAYTKIDDVEFEERSTEVYGVHLVIKQ